MTLVVDVSAEGVRAPLGAGRVRDTARLVMRAEGVRNALLSIAFVSPRVIARLNRTHLGRSGATDVIAFGMRAPGVRRDTVIGDIYIAPDVARRNARDHRAGIREELARLVVHGTLHVLGHDHPEGVERVDSPMWRRQEALVRRARTRGLW